MGKKIKVMEVMRRSEVTNYKLLKYSARIRIIFFSSLKRCLNLCLLMYFITNSAIKLTRFPVGNFFFLYLIVYTVDVILLLSLLFIYFNFFFFTFNTFTRPLNIQKKKNEDEECKRQRIL